jgi:hypothetical protein
MKDDVHDGDLSSRFQRAAADIAAKTPIARPPRAATEPGPLRLYRSVSPWSLAGPQKLRHSLALALAVLVVSAGVAYAAVAIATVPTHVTVTGPNGQGLPPPLVSPRAVVIPGVPKTVTFAQAQADVPYRILVLPASFATPQQWQVIPPTTTQSGGPVVAGEVMEPQVFVTYLLSSGPTVTISEYPEKAGTPLNYYVKWYGAPSTHQATIDGYHVVYQSTGTTVSDFVFKTTTGLEVWMSSSQKFQQPSSEPIPMTITQWESVLGVLSPSPRSTVSSR